jgi:hypothetical protein
VGEHVSRNDGGKAARDSHGRQPDWGKPTVRDDTGGLGKHGYGGIVTPPRNRKSGTENPPPKVRAPKFYPDKGHHPAGAGSNLQRPLGISVDTKSWWRVLVWRMSP